MAMSSIGKSVDNMVEKEFEDVEKTLGLKQAKGKTGVDLSDKKSITDSRWLHGFMAGVIAFNTITMGIEADHPEWTLVWSIVENFVTAAFALEMALNIFSLRCDYFKRMSSIIDCVITLFAIYSCWISPFLNAKHSVFQTLTMLRLLRLGRLMRVVRLMESLKPMVVLVQGVISTVHTLGSVFLLLALIYYVLAIFLTENLGNMSGLADVYPGYAASTEELDEQGFMQDFNPYLHFGTMGLSMLTLFNMSLMAEWPEIVRPIALKQPLFLLFFMAFVVFVVFGVMNVMIGQIFDQVQTESARLEAEYLQKKRNIKLEYLQEIEGFLNEMDTNGDGLISLQELSTAMDSDPALVELLSKIDLPSGWAPAELLAMLDKHGEGTIPKASFATSFFRLIEADDFQLTCILQAGLNRVAHGIAIGNSETQSKLDAIEEELKSVKLAICSSPGSHGRHPRDAQLFEKAMSEAIEKNVTEDFKQLMETMRRESREALDSFNVALNLASSTWQEARAQHQQMRFEHALENDHLIQGFSFENGDASMCIETGALVGDQKAGKALRDPAMARTTASLGSSLPNFTASTSQGSGLANPTADSANMARSKVLSYLNSLGFAK